jgi:hypothetical protein
MEKQDRKQVRSKTDTLLRNLAKHAKNEHVRLKACVWLLYLEGRANRPQSASKSGKNQAKLDGLSELMPGQSSSD